MSELLQNNNEIIIVFGYGMRLKKQYAKRADYNSPSKPGKNPFNLFNINATVRIFPKIKWYIDDDDTFL